MPIKVPKSEYRSATGTLATNNTGYNSADANALVRLALRFRHNKYRPMVVSLAAHTIKGKSIRIYFYRAKQFIRENPNTYTPEVQEIVAAMRFRLREDEILIDCAPRGDNLARMENQRTDLAGVKGADYKGRQLFVHWISDIHEQGEYVDIPGQFTEEDLKFFRSMGADYKTLITIEFTAENVRVVWIADTKKGQDESPW